MPTEEEAHAVLEEAIEAFLEACQEPGLLLDWVLVAHKINPEADGTDRATTTYVGSEKQTQYRTLGLLEYGAQVVRVEIDESMRGMDD